MWIIQLQLCYFVWSPSYTVFILLKTWNLDMDCGFLFNNHVWAHVRIFYNYPHLELNT